MQIFLSNPLKQFFKRWSWRLYCFKHDAFLCFRNAYTPTFLKGTFLSNLFWQTYTQTVTPFLNFYFRTENINYIYTLADAAVLKIIVTVTLFISEFIFF